MADQRQHYNMARSMAVLSLSFIILVTPWTMKEVAVSCIGSKVSLSFEYYTVHPGLAALILSAFFHCSPREKQRKEIMVGADNSTYYSFTVGPDGSAS